MIYPAVAIVLLPYNTLIVAAGVAAVGCAAGVIGTFGVLRKRALVGDAAAHATLVGVASALLMSSLCVSSFYDVLPSPLARGVST